MFKDYDDITKVFILLLTPIIWKPRLNRLMNIKGPTISGHTSLTKCPVENNKAKPFLCYSPLNFWIGSAFCAKYDQPNWQFSEINFSHPGFAITIVAHMVSLFSATWPARQAWAIRWARSETSRVRPSASWSAGPRRTASTSPGSGTGHHLPVLHLGQVGSPPARTLPGSGKLGRLQPASTYFTLFSI